MKRLKKINNLIHVIYKILFNKKSNFRNVILKTPEEFFNVEEDLNKLVKFNFSEHNPFNGQKIRTDIIKNIISNGDFDKIVETGTHIGNTTKFFSNFDIPIETIEINDYYFQISKLRFSEVENIKVIKGNSQEYLENLDRNINYFIYLDAHWYSELPLNKELEILSKIKNQIILIDDFKVPFDNSWEYDEYEGVELSLKFINIPKNFKLFFPNYNPTKEKNAYRGYVLLTSSQTYYKKLSKIELLSEYNN